MPDPGNGTSLTASMGTGNQAAITIALIGTRHMFSPCMARTMASEIDDADVIRFDDLDGFIDAMSGNRAPARLVFMDPGSAAAVADISAEALAGFGTANRAVAYENASEIEPVFATLRGAAGIRGFLPMHVRLDVWLSIIRLLASGGSYVPDELVGFSSPPRFEPRAADGPTIGALTPRENEVLELVAKGVQNKNIASKLTLSEHTVKLHIHHIISKLGVRNRTEAAARFFERSRA